MSEEFAELSPRRETEGRLVTDPNLIEGYFRRGLTPGTIVNIGGNTNRIIDADLTGASGPTYLVSVKRAGENDFNSIGQADYSGFSPKTIADGGATIQLPPDESPETTINGQRAVDYALQGKLKSGDLLKSIQGRLFRNTTSYVTGSTEPSVPLNRAGVLFIDTFGNGDVVPKQKQIILDTASEDEIRLVATSITALPEIRPNKFKSEVDVNDNDLAITDPDAVAIKLQALEPNDILKFGNRRALRVVGTDGEFTTFEEETPQGETRRTRFKASEISSGFIESRNISVITEKRTVDIATISETAAVVDYLQNKLKTGDIITSQIGVTLKVIEVREGTVILEKSVLNGEPKQVEFSFQDTRPETVEAVGFAITPVESAAQQNNENEIKEIQRRVEMFREDSKLGILVKYLLSEPRYAKALISRIKQARELIKTEGREMRISETEQSLTEMTKPLMAALLLNADTAHLTMEALKHDLEYRSLRYEGKVLQTQAKIERGEFDDPDVLKYCTSNTFVIGIGINGPIFMTKLNQEYGHDVKITAVNDSSAISVFGKLAPDALTLNNGLQPVDLRPPGAGREKGSLGRFNLDAFVQVSMIASGKYATNTQIEQAATANVAALDASLLFGYEWFKTLSKYDDQGEVIPGREKWPAANMNMCRNSRGEVISMFSETTVSAGGIGRDTFGGLENNEVVESYRGSAFFTYIEYMNLPMRDLVGKRIALVGNFGDGVKSAAERTLRLVSQAAHAPRKDQPGSIGSPVQEGDVLEIIVDAPYRNCRELLVGYLLDEETGERFDLTKEDYETLAQLGTNDGKEKVIEGKKRILGARGRYLQLVTEFKRDKNDPDSIKIPRRIRPVEGRLVDVREERNDEGAPIFTLIYKDGDTITEVEDVDIGMFATGFDKETALREAAREVLPAIRDPDELRIFFEDALLRPGDQIALRDRAIVTVKSIQGDEVELVNARGKPVRPGEISSITVSELINEVRKGELESIIPNPNDIRDIGEAISFVQSQPIEIGDRFVGEFEDIIITQKLPDGTFLYSVIENATGDLRGENFGTSRTALAQELRTGVTAEIRVANNRRGKGLLDNPDLVEYVIGPVEGRDEPSRVAQKIRGTKIYVINPAVGILSKEETVGIEQNTVSYGLNGPRNEGAAIVIGQESKITDDNGVEVRLPDATVDKLRQELLVGNGTIVERGFEVIEAEKVQTSSEDELPILGALAQDETLLAVANALTEAGCIFTNIEPATSEQVNTREPSINQLVDERVMDVRFKPTLEIEVQPTEGEANSIDLRIAVSITQNGRDFIIQKDPYDAGDIVSAIEVYGDLPNMLASWVHSGKKNLRIKIPIGSNGRIRPQGMRLEQISKADKTAGVFSPIERSRLLQQRKQQR